MTLLVVKDLTISRAGSEAHIVREADFALEPGETLGIAGESGCGKSTLLLALMGVVKPGLTMTGGHVRLLDQDLATLTPEDMRRLRGQSVAMVPQSAAMALTPTMRVGAQLAEAMAVHDAIPSDAIAARTAALFARVRLPEPDRIGARYPHELFVLDEPTSALDVSVQAQILNLLSDLQRDRNLAYLFVTHDLSVVRHMADRLVTMYLGRVVETGPTRGIFDRAEHPYTRALMAAKPDLADGAAGMRALEGVVPDPARPPQGCRFHTRCEVATPACGWEVDDVVRWLEHRDWLFDALTGVARDSAFAARLTFADAAAAARLDAALRSDAVPPAMRAALDRQELRGTTLDLAFRPVPEVTLTARGPDRAAACLLTAQDPERTT